ncbi:DUF6907 domain-containing protein [Pseudosporangium ferrugineum]|uniref:Uncharacterized protein n=1 Tax=Pseudosporangium ferrugineum TaxID=439699 RepID=A0A2T0RSD6_9ACTN|nr:hypothetical protein [Pseudosporangium ferrugineum]PRY24037.1 hypothetical protein CLV70_114170 [Pseudosporangium ferrugineum]
MTAVLEPTTSHDYLLSLQARFDATRPACPPFCDGTCTDLGHFGDAIMHSSVPLTLPCTPDMKDANTADVELVVCRYDALEEPSEEYIDLNIERSGNLIYTDAVFTAQQAYDLGAALMAAARQLSGELQVFASDVKIGDLIEVDGGWMHVYGVLADKPSDNVQVFVTADPDEFSDFEYRDDNPEHFKLGDRTCIRRRPSVGSIR